MKGCPVFSKQMKATPVDGKLLTTLKSQRTSKLLWDVFVIVLFFSCVFWGCGEIGKRAGFKIRR
jgi:hypothetical protein